MRRRSARSRAFPRISPRPLAGHRRAWPRPARRGRRCDRAAACAELTPSRRGAIASRQPRRLGVGSSRGLDVLQAELLGLLVVAEQLGVAAPGDRRCAACPRRSRATCGPPARRGSAPPRRDGSSARRAPGGSCGDQRHMRAQRGGEQLLALVGVGLRRSGGPSSVSGCRLPPARRSAAAAASRRAAAVRPTSICSDAASAGRSARPL